MTANFFGRAALAALALGMTAQPAIAQDGYLRITNNAQGTNYSFDLGDLKADGTQWAVMLPTSQAAGQYWQFDGSANGGIQLRSDYTGPGLCLDAAGDGTLFMDVCGPQIGQRWQVREVPGQGVTITNSYKPGQCLDIGTTSVSNNIVIALLAPCTGSASQVWTVAVTGKS